MPKQNIETSSFTLAKGAQLKGDDFFEVKVMQNITVAVVCDGVGSCLHGDQAAKRVVQFLTYSLKNRPRSWSMEKSIREFIHSINRILYMESMQQYDRPELVTTLALAVIEGERLYGANVGDSRIYLLRNDQILQLSYDHTDEQMSGALTAAVGLQERVEPFYFENNLKTKDTILLCSDGLYSELDESELATHMRVSASQLVKSASRKHDDNLPDDTTAVVLEIVEIDPRFRLKQSKLIIKQNYTEGEVIDGYTLLEPLEQNRRTWLCKNRGVNYVIKFAPCQALDDELLLDLFVKEVWVAKRLKAGFFPKAVIPKKRTHRYYVMNYIDGVSLKEYIAKKPLSVDLGVEFARFLLKMSQFLMKYNLVHGDIKPENIIVTKRGEKVVFKMVDFGNITEAYSITTRAGTPSYMAPERFAQTPISEQTEIFAIGVTLYEALTRSYPYGEIEPFQNPSFERAPKAPSMLNAKIPSWLQSIMLHALQSDPDKRYFNYSQMLYEIENPQKVQHYFDKHISFFERHEKMVYKVGFAVMFILNIVQLLFFH